MDLVVDSVIDGCVRRPGVREDSKHSQGGKHS